MFVCFALNAQENDLYSVHTIAFYNVENLFDTEEDSLVYDDAFTPEGSYHWTGERYTIKIDHLAQVIAGIGLAYRKSPPDILGLCEVENLKVLQDLVAHPLLQAFNYGIIHGDSPDERGIDVAMLFKKDTFLPTAMNYHSLKLLNEQRFREYTRDQLVVYGFLDHEAIYFIINHWPSRRGGESRSRPHRIAAAELNLTIIDSIKRIENIPRIIGLGDFNDNPTDYTFTKVLRTKNNSAGIADNELFNPMEQLFKKGEGSLAYRDRWSLFDQIYVSGNLINGNASIKVWKAGIYNPSFLRIQQGPFKGYPLRTYAGGRYTSGYSDHFPVYLYLVKRLTSLRHH
jgi:predicted extracellular nuclease